MIAWFNPDSNTTTMVSLDALPRSERRRDRRPTPATVPAENKPMHEVVVEWSEEWERRRTITVRIKP